ncbi:hypothetical protein [Rhodopirellula sp. MGV]|uniref:hypothetical protein n=1 Tax=Rhodopirellula sp. MGV TaxID=2023130 RepID=UPI000B967547|nr:hypothetical protein [Rhodopirellula sp. MGV]OYP35371.1 hypothetical protein CGZ80_11925 [Rhodopirellula sp. MGV]PNY37741.1 hypothetical protein C2E31_06295 [Rhodopirellula baltica]
MAKLCRIDINTFQMLAILFLLIGSGISSGINGMSQEFVTTRFMDADDAETAIGMIRNEGKVVVTFCGYSGLGYQNPKRLNRIAEQVLASLDPKRTIVNVGGTAVGIGQVYDVAKKMGFRTTGVVSILAKQYPDGISKNVDLVVYVKDDTWGGLIKDGELSETSKAVVECSDSLIGIGGGAVAGEELSEALRCGKPVRFFTAEMNHANAIKKAERKSQPVPTDFRGEAHRAMEANQHLKIEHD